MNTEQNNKQVEKPIFISMRLDFDVHREIKALAALKGKKVNDIIREFVETRWIDEKPLERELSKNNL